MKRIILLIFASMVGLVLLVGGIYFAVLWHEVNKVSFDDYMTHAVLKVDEDGNVDRAAEERIFYPSFGNARPMGYVMALDDCYQEVDGACFQYAAMVSKHYNANADLTFTVEKDGDIVTIRFTGTGYPENGEPENLDRTYIFDVEDAGRDKLPRLVNRAEFIGY